MSTTFKSTRHNKELDEFDQRARSLGMRYAELQQIESVSRMGRMSVPPGFVKVKDRIAQEGEIKNAEENDN